MRHGTTGYRNGCRCQACSLAQAVYNERYRADNAQGVRETRRAGMAKARAAEPQKHLQRQREFLAANPGYRAAAHYKRQYGLTPTERRAMYEAQGRKCLVCREAIPDVPGLKGPHTDHVHGTKVVRGILHGNCNSALGLLKEDPVRMERAARYVRTGGRFDDWQPGIGEGLV